MEVQSLCVERSGTGWSCSSPDNFANIDKLDISFKRPNFNAIFYASKNGTALTGIIISAKIIVKSPNGSDKYAVIVSGLGQITVKKEP